MYVQMSRQTTRLCAHVRLFVHTMYPQGFLNHVFTLYINVVTKSQRTKISE